MEATIRILFMADSHLGFDLPAAPRVSRRRRGHDFLANHRLALERALAGDVDAVVHGGDVFHRPKVPPSLAWQAFEPLARVAASGVPVFIAPGNHERSRMPHARFAAHRHLHVFDRPRTFPLTVGGIRLSVAGFPYERRDVRSRFPDIVARTGWRADPGAVNLLCMHQCVEGATVGPGNFTFTTARDVVRCSDLPTGLTAVLSGHIHRHQVLTRDLAGRKLASPVLYPGSVERTSFAEMDEPKGYIILDASPTGIRWSFAPLPARPMRTETLDARGLGPTEMDAALRSLIDRSPRDAVLRIRITGPLPGENSRLWSARRLRSIAPDTMSIDVHAPDALPFRRRTRPTRPPPVSAGQPPAQLEIGGL